jgi:hypothetical protein
MPRQKKPPPEVLWICPYFPRRGPPEESPHTFTHQCEYWQSFTDFARCPADCPGPVPYVPRDKED